MKNKNYEPRAGDLIYYHYGPGYLLITGVCGSDVSYTWSWAESNRSLPSKGPYIVPLHSVLYSMNQKRPGMSGYSAELISRCDE